MSQVLTLDLDNKNEVLDFTINENKNIISNVSDAFSNAVCKGVDLIELSDELKETVKTEAKSIDFKKIGGQVTEAALRIGTKAMGLNVSTFNSIKEVFEALKAGNLKESLSAAIDVGVDLIKNIPVDAKKLIKSSKDILLGDTLNTELQEVMVKQKNTIDRLNKKCNKFEEALSNNNEKEMSKQVKSIKSELDKVMLIENTIIRARGILNQYELMKNKATVELSETEKEVCEKLAQ